MTTQKVSVTLDADVLDRVRRVVGPRGLSAYLDQALAEQLLRDERRTELILLLDEAEASDPTPGDVRIRGRMAADRIRRNAAP